MSSKKPMFIKLVADPDHLLIQKVGPAPVLDAFVRSAIKNTGGKLVSVTKEGNVAFAKIKVPVIAKAFWRTDRTAFIFAVFPSVLVKNYGMISVEVSFSKID